MKFINSLTRNKLLMSHTAYCHIQALRFLTNTPDHPWLAS